MKLIITLKNVHKKGRFSNNIIKQNVLIIILYQHSRIIISTSKHNSFFNLIIWNAKKCNIPEKFHFEWNSVYPPRFPLSAVWEFFFFCSEYHSFRLEQKKKRRTMNELKIPRHMASWEITVALKNPELFFISFWRSVLSVLHYLPMEFCFEILYPHTMLAVVITLCNDTKPSFFYTQFVYNLDFIWNWMHNPINGWTRFSTRSYLTAKLYYILLWKIPGFYFISLCHLRLLLLFRKIPEKGLIKKKKLINKIQCW